MSDSKEIKASISFVCALNPNPVVEFDKLTCVRNSQGNFMPAVRACCALGGGREMYSRMPIFSFECFGEDKIEEARTLLHERIDRTFDEYKRQWDLKVKELEEAAAKRQPMRPIQEVIGEKNKAAPEQETEQSQQADNKNESEKSGD